MTDIAIKKILNDDIVAMPTETVYGLAGAIDSPIAIEKIFKVKERPFFDPLIVHVNSIEMARELTSSWNKNAQILAENFWPGPITLVLPKNDSVSDLITSGLKSVGIRIPSHPQALELISKTNKPLAAPSANKFTKTSPTESNHVKEEFGEEIHVIEGGRCQIGIESTVLGVFENEIKIYRPGMITENDLRLILPDHIQITQGESPVAPGALKHHYMPNKPVTLTTEPSKDPKTSSWIVPIDPQIAARQLYSKLREMDLEKTSKIEIILKNEFKENEKFKGILNRLDKAKTIDHYFK